MVIRITVLIQDLKVSLRDNSTCTNFADNASHCWWILMQFLAGQNVSLATNHSYIGLMSTASWLTSQQIELGPPNTVERLTLALSHVIFCGEGIEMSNLNIWKHVDCTVALGYCKLYAQRGKSFRYAQFLTSKLILDKNWQCGKEKKGDREGSNPGGVDDCVLLTTHPVTTAAIYSTIQ